MGPISPPSRPIAAESCSAAVGGSGPRSAAPNVADPDRSSFGQTAPVPRRKSRRRANRVRRSRQDAVRDADPRPSRCRTLSGTPSSMSTSVLDSPARGDISVDLPSTRHGLRRESLAAERRAIRAEDSVVLTGDQRIYLHELVSPGRWWRYTRAYPKACGNAMVEGLRRELRPAAIGALGSLGDGSSVSVLEQFARTTSDPDLRHSALHSVDQIRQRLQNSSPQQWGEKVER